jgi:hypothetical protein
MTYLLLSGCSGFCTASAVYFLCDGTGFTSFSCSPPAAPWTPWDPASTLPDGGTTFDATTLDAGTGDAQTGDASDGVPDASSRG